MLCHKFRENFIFFEDYAFLLENFIKNNVKSLYSNKVTFVYNLEVKNERLTPGTCDLLSNESGKKVYFMLEFLTERIAYEDFCKKSLIFTGEVELLKNIFIGKYNNNEYGLEHVRNPKEIIEKCHKWLKKDGEIFLFRPLMALNLKNLKNITT